MKCETMATLIKRTATMITTNINLTIVIENKDNDTFQQCYVIP